MPLLDVRSLTTVFSANETDKKAVREISFSIEEGETLGLVGESGSGKTVTALSILRLIDEPGRIVSGEIIFDGLSLLDLDDKAIRRIRGEAISIVFQEPLTALNPVFTIGRQIVETFIAHRDATVREARRAALKAMEEVHLRDPERIFGEYPHRLSGGMRQRAMIAMALVLRPKLLIADEPTTALDVTIQAEILELFREIKKVSGMSILFITHDLGIMAALADRLCVMKEGRIVERGTVFDIFSYPKAEYTKELLKAIPRISPDMRKGW